MINNIISRTWHQGRLVNIDDLTGFLFQEESSGHTFEIAGVDDSGAAVSLSGTVTGVFKRADNADIALEGSISGGKAYVALSEDCYSVPGASGLTVFVSDGDQKVAVYAAILRVSQTYGGAVAGDTPQDVVDLINAINAAVAAIPADYTDLMDASASYSIKSFTNYSDYTSGPFSQANTIISTIAIPAGSFVHGVSIRFAETTTNYNSWVYLIDNSTKQILRKVILPTKNAWQTALFDYLCETDCVIGFCGGKIRYRAEFVANPDMITGNHPFSVGLNQGSTQFPDVGDIITVSSTSTNAVFALPVDLLISGNEITAPELAEYTEKANSAYAGADRIFPCSILQISNYNVTVSLADFIVSDSIEAGAFIKTVEFYNYTASANQYLYIIDAITNKVLDKIYNNAVSSGFVVIPINRQYANPVRVGLYGHSLKARYSSPAFMTGYRTASPASADVGDSVTITSNNDGKKYCFPVSVVYSSGSESTSDRTTFELISGIRPGASLPSIACFVDDDTGQYVPSIWGPILTETGIRMGFACVTGYMSGAVSPSRPEYVQMSENDLRTLYNAGNEVYSHSYSHPAFYESTDDDIETQCRLSKQWLDDNGFGRTSDIIIYPGGLGFGAAKESARNIVKQFYRYGVDASGGAINTPYTVKSKPYAIRRANADTSTLADLEAFVDSAYTAGNVLLVFMNHAYQMNSDAEAQKQKMIDLINYIKSKGILIMPLGEALHRANGW